MSDTWRWEYGYAYGDEPGYRSTMDVLVPDPTSTIEPFGFSRRDLMQAWQAYSGWTGADPGRPHHDVTGDLLRMAAAA